jgi:hypothetical protein
MIQHVFFSHLMHLNKNVLQLIETGLTDPKPQQIMPAAPEIAKNVFA